MNTAEMKLLQMLLTGLRTEFSEKRFKKISDGYCRADFFLHQWILNKYMLKMIVNI